MKSKKISQLLIIVLIIAAAIIFVSRPQFLGNSSGESWLARLWPSSQTVIKTSDSGELKFLFFGDLMLDRHVGDQIKANGLDYLFAPLIKSSSSFFGGYDLVSANLEGALTDGGTHYLPSNAYDFAFNPKLISDLKKYNFNYFSLANNHFSDQGTKGVLETRKNLSDLNFNFSGSPDAVVDADSLSTMELDGQKITLIGLSMVYHDFDLEAAKQLIANNRASSSLIIVNIHWGNEYQHQFNTHQQNIAHELIDSGADLIIGHHPHVVQGMEVYKNKAIFYSLGNFVFDQYFSSDTQESLAIGLAISSTSSKIFLFPLRSQMSAVNLMSENNRQKFLEKYISWSQVDDSIKAQIRKSEIVIP